MIRGSMSSKIAGPVLCLLVVAVSVGCGENISRGYVSGNVKQIGGEPAVGVTVVARSATTGKSGSGVTNGEGKYELGVEHAGDGLPPGEYTVVILEDIGDWDHPKPGTIARKYADHSTSGLSLSVADGENREFNVELDKP